MKTQRILSVLIFSLCIAVKVMGQDAIDKYFGAMQDDPDVTSIVISSKMFQLFAKLDADSEEGKAAMDAMRGLTGIRILAKEDSKEGANALQQAVKGLGKEYETLMSIDDKDEKVRFFIREKDDVVEEMLMLVGGKTNFFVMSISGNIDLAKLSSLSKSMNVGGMNYLENLNEKEKKE